MSRTFSFTSESVSEGHPDKVADQISDAVLDAILTADPRGRVACETLVKTGVVIVAGTAVVVEARGNKAGHITSASRVGVGVYLLEPLYYYNNLCIFIHY